MVPCFDEAYWASDYKEKIKGSDLEINLISRRYDVSDPNSPLKYNFQSILIPLSSSGVYYSFVNVIKNEYLINDWYSFFYLSDSKSFYSFEIDDSYYKYNEYRKFPFISLEIKYYISYIV